MRVLCVLSLMFFAGCGSAESGRRAVSGSVQVAGQPLEAGMITFVPQPGTTAPAASTVVSGGSYRFTAANGPLPGEYTVRVSSSAIAEASSAAPEAGAPEVAATAPEASIRSKRGISSAVAGDSAAASAPAAAVPQPLQWATPVTVSAEGSATKDFNF